MIIIKREEEEEKEEEKEEEEGYMVTAEDVTEEETITVTMAITGMFTIPGVSITLVRLMLLGNVEEIIIMNLAMTLLTLTA
jgi:CO dehydrogenase/acetyl-CoA synthase beta subunit